VRRATGSSGNYETYLYDGSRRRFLELGSDSAHSWRFQIGGEYEYEHRSDGVDQASVYVAGAGEPIARVTECASQSGCSSITPVVTLLHHDRRGDLLASFAENGALQSHFTYGAFGEVLHSYNAISGLDDWRREFNGKERDAVDGLNYYGYRYYDPLTLQWTSGDPAYRFAPDLKPGEPQRLNIYAFSLNNPHRYEDPNGLDSTSAQYQTETTADYEGYRDVGFTSKVAGKLVEAGNLGGLEAQEGVLAAAGSGALGGQTFGTAQAAAKAVLTVYNPWSIQTNSEYGGLIYIQPGGDKLFRLSGTVKATADEGHVNTESAERYIEGPHVVRADWHTHGGNQHSTKREAELNEDLSPGDRKGASQSHFPMDTRFLGTPTGRMKSYDIKSQKTTDIGPTEIRPPAGQKEPPSYGSVDPKK
jgi:RHS repeat-associated protein